MTRKLRTTARILLGIYLVAVLTLCVINLSSRKTDETIFVILLTRHAYHTSAVLLR